MAQTLGAPDNVGDLVLIIDGVQEGKVGKGGLVVVVGGQAFGILPNGLCRDLGQNVVSLRSRLRGLLVREIFGARRIAGGDRRAP